MTPYDNGGRRSGVDRRNFTYSLHIPEKRSGQDRRSGFDRREMQAFRTVSAAERRAWLSKPTCFAIQAKATKCQQF